MSFKALYEKYKDLIPYGIFGVLTTLANIYVYKFCAHTLKLGTTASNALAWFVAVLFAYLTNRKWVFHSEAKGAKEIWREVLTFYAGRIATGLLDMANMWVFVDALHLNDMVIKWLSNIVVILLNYVLSKKVIFKHKD